MGRNGTIKFSKTWRHSKGDGVLLLAAQLHCFQQLLPQIPLKTEFRGSERKEGEGKRFLILSKSSVYIVYIEIVFEWFIYHVVYLYLAEYTISSCCKFLFLP